MESSLQQFQRVKSISQTIFSAFLQHPSSKQYKQYLIKSYSQFTDKLKHNKIFIQPTLLTLALEYGPYSQQVDKQIRSLKTIPTEIQRNLLRQIFFDTYMNKDWKDKNGKYLSQIIKDFEKSINQQKNFPQSILQMDQRQETDLLNFQSIPLQQFQEIQYRNDQDSQQERNQSQSQNKKQDEKQNKKQNKKQDKNQQKRPDQIKCTIKDMKKRYNPLINQNSNNSNNSEYQSIQPRQNSQFSQLRIQNTSKKIYPNVENDQIQSQQSEKQQQNYQRSQIQQQQEEQEQKQDLLYRTIKEKSKNYIEQSNNKQSDRRSQQKISNHINQKIKQNKYNYQQFNPRNNKNNQQNPIPNQNQYPISYLSPNFNYPHQFINPLIQQNIMHPQQWNQPFIPNLNMPFPMGYPYQNQNPLYNSPNKINKRAETNRQYSRQIQIMEKQDSSQQSIRDNRRGKKKLSQRSTSKSIQKRQQQYKRQDKRYNKRIHKRNRRLNRKEVDQQYEYEEDEQKKQQKKRIQQILQGLKQLNSKINPQVINKQSYIRQDDNKIKLQQQLQQIYLRINEYRQYLNKSKQQQIKQLDIQQQSKQLFQKIQQQYNKLIIQKNKKIQISNIHYKPNNIMSFNTYYQSSKQQFINNIYNINSLEIFNQSQLIHSQSQQRLNIQQHNQFNYINIKQFYDTYQIISQFYITFNNLNQFINIQEITKYTQSLFIQQQIINSFTYSLQSDLKLLGAQLLTHKTKQYISDLYYKHHRPLFQNPINNLKQLPINISPNQYDKFIKFMDKQLPNKILKNPFKIIQKDKLLSKYNKYKYSNGQVHKLIISQIVRQTLIQNVKNNQSSYKQIINGLTKNCIQKYYQQLSKIGLTPNGQTYIDQQPLVIIDLYNVKPLKLSTTQQLQNIIDSLSQFVNKDKIKSNIRSVDDNVYKKKQLIASITEIKTSLKQQFNKYTFLLNYKKNKPANLTQNLNKNQLINFINFIKKYINYDKILCSIKKVIQNTLNPQDIHKLVFEVFSTLQNQCNQCNDQLCQISLSLSSKFKSQLHIFAKILVWKYLQIKKDQQNKIIKNTIQKSMSHQLKIFSEMFLSNNKPK